ncbi:MAG: U32 family peptidase [Treponema sp.]|nr:U32 family peptidase [Treponema sp.]
MNVEILSPAGDAKAFKAAIAAKADAIYFGLGTLNARVRAKNISKKELPYLIALAKSKNIRIYLTLNILLKDCEFENAIETVKYAYSCGVDAIIVQDLGLLHILRKIFSNIEIHASTQLTTHNTEQCKFLSEFNVNQINLSRELSLNEIKNINQFLKSKSIVSEVFVHGAFCISFSGQCYFSEKLYNQAGNRGECVQPCRRLYKTKDKSFSGTPFNLRDNNCFEIIDKLIQAGCGSLKIEGRIKDANYVYSVTSAYVQQLENIKEEKKLLLSSKLLSNSMNRNFTHDYVNGNISSSMFHFGKKDESIETIGKVKKYFAKEKILTLQINDNKKIFENDKLIIKNKKNEFVCTCIIKKVLSKNSCEIQITNKLFSKIFENFFIERQLLGVPKNFLDKQINILEENFQKNFEKNNYQKINTINIKNKISINVKILFCNDSKKLKCIFYFYNKRGEEKKVEVFSKTILSLAQNKSLEKNIFIEKFSKLGGTNYLLEKIDFDNSLEKYFLPISELNEIRRNAVTLLDNINDESFVNQNKIISKFYSQNNFFNDNEKLFLFTEHKIKIIEIPNYINSIDEIVINIKKHNDVIPYFPAIIFDDELVNHVQLLNILPRQKIICDNYGLAFYASKKGFQIILGQRMNITNSFSLQSFCEKLNVVGFIPSIEMTCNDVKQLYIPNNIIIYKIQNYNFPLLESRQCLLKNLTACKKYLCDKDCLINCEKKIQFVGLQGEKLVAKKRKGFYSAIFFDEDIK